MSFSSLGLSAALLKAVTAQLYTEAYPIQQQAIPAILKGQDVYGIAQTGSGKTAAYVLPLLDMLQGRSYERSRQILGLVLVPTRELALQVNEVFQSFAAALPRKVKSMAVHGGVSINPQMIALLGTEVLVATPGRLIDLLSTNALQLNRLEVLVLDEADRMLDLGFKDEIDKIFSLLPHKRQNILFSATQTDDIAEIKDKLLKAPVFIEIKAETEAPALINQLAYLVAPERKGLLLRYLIKEQNMQQVLVFASAIRTADNLVGKLKKNKIDAAALHSQKSQGARTEVLNRFKSGKLKVLVATDLAARGIDIQKLPHVINFELPRSPKDYVHRIGRTGRAEAKGEAISLITPEDQHHFKIIQKKMGLQVPVLETEDIALDGY